MRGISYNFPAPLCEEDVLRTSSHNGILRSLQFRSFFMCVCCSIYKLHCASTPMELQKFPLSLLIPFGERGRENSIDKINGNKHKKRATRNFFRSTLPESRKNERSMLEMKLLDIIQFSIHLSRKSASLKTKRKRSGAGCKTT
jgi:hypothetical protein